MGSLESLRLLWTDMALTLGKVSQRDIMRVNTGISHSGLGYLTKVLPELGKAVYLSLEIGILVPPKAFGDGLTRPKFLAQLFSECYNADCTLRSLQSPYLAARLRVILQLTMFAYKMETPLEDDACHVAWERFKNKQLEDVKDIPSTLLQYAKRLIHRVIGELDPLSVIPKHSAGAVAEPTCTPSTRWTDPFNSFEYIKEIDDVFGYDNLLYANDNHLVDEYQLLDTLRCGSIPARVTFVPKDSRGPRLISCEPVVRQYIKQGLMNLLYTKISQCPLTKWNIPLRDQTYAGLGECRLDNR